MAATPNLQSRGEVETTVRRALAWLESNAIGVFWGALKNDEAGLKASWDVDLAADVEPFLALAKAAAASVVFVDCILYEAKDLHDEEAATPSPDLERLTRELAPHVGELAEVTFSWVGARVIHQFTIKASWADDYFAAMQLVGSDEDEDEDPDEDSPDEEEVRRHADALARDPKFQAARSAAQRSYAARKFLDDSVWADLELRLAVLSEAKNIFEVELKPEVDKRTADEVQSLRDQGLTKAQIARRLGISANKMKTMF